VTGLPFASVVVASDLRRPDLLDRALKALCALDYPDFEILLVDNRPTAGAELTPDDPRVRVIREPKPGASAARNAGIRAAGGEIVAFTDDDVDVDPGWLRAIAQRFADEPDADAVTGAVYPAELETPAQQWFERHGAGSERRYAKASFRRKRFRVEDRIGGTTASMYKLGPYGTGANMAFRAGVLHRLGGFDEALGPGTPTMAGEDIELFLRLLARGHRLAVEPSASVRHTHRRTYPELRDQMEGYGRGLTAMLTASVLRDPWHLVGLILIVIPGTFSMFRSGLSSAAPGENPAGRSRLSGLFHGPAAYLASRRKMRRWNR
jgi:GT2 family glycosyltransferase